MVVVIVVGLLLWRYLSSYESTDDAQADVHLYSVSARISGYVIGVNVNDNQWVNKGDVLVEVDPTDYQVALAQAQANLANAEATARSLNITVPITSVNSASQLEFTASGIEDARAAVSAAEKQLAAAHEQVEAAQANDVRAQDDLRRYKLLVNKREVSPQIYDQALASAKSSTANVAAAQASESAAQQFVQQAQSRLLQAAANHASAQTGPQQVSSTKARVQAAVADVQQKRAASSASAVESAIHQNHAPVSGEVNKTVVVGLNVEPGQQLLTVVPLDEVWVTANFKETQLKHMQVGQNADIHVDSSGRTLHGHVDSIAGATGPLFSLLPPENATGNYVKIVQRIPVKIVLDPGENRDRQASTGHERSSRRIPKMTTAALTLDQDIWRPRYNPWLVAVVVALAAFMEVLDTSIANVALPYMAGNLGASNDQSTWVLTSYLVSNAIILPMTGWLAGAFGRKRFFMSCLGDLYGEFLALRDRAQPGLSASLPSSARSGRWRLTTYGSGHSGGHVSRPKTRACICSIWNHRHHGAHDWPDSGWMDNVQLFLALDFLHQPSGRCDYLAVSAPFCRRSSISSETEESRSEVGLRGHRAIDRRGWRFADSARQGTGRRLVWITLHHDPHYRCFRMPDLSGASGSGSRKHRLLMCGCSRASTLPAPV